MAWRPPTETDRSMIRLMADFVITTSLSARYSPIGWPPRTRRVPSIMRSSISMPPASSASSAGSISSSVVAVRKPRPPRLTPRIGTPQDPAAQHGIAGQALDGHPVVDGIAHNTALADVLTADLELWLDEGDHLAARRQHAEDGRQHLLEGDERDIDDRQRRLVVEDARVEGASVGLLHHHHARVLAELDVELGGADVDGEHPAGAPLEQAVREAARRRPDVDAHAPLDREGEVIEGVDELLAAPADVGRSAAEVDVGVARNQGASLVDPLAVDHDL